MTENNAFLEFLLNISTNIFLELDRYSRILYASAKAQYIFCISHPEGTLKDYLPGEVVKTINNHLKNVLYQNYPENFNITINERVYNVFAYPFENHIVLCLEDITERRHLSHHLYQTKQRLEFAEKTAHLGYWELDLNAKRFYWSAEMYRIFGLDAKNISHKRNLIRDQILEEDLPLYKKQITELVKNGHPVEGQVRVRRADRRIVYCLFKASIIYDNNGERIAGTFQDITPLVETQLQLKAAKQEADRLNMEKSYFLAQASHDLRQPMQALTMFISALEDDKLNSEQASIVEKISASANNLKSLLDNLLDISKLDSGGMDYQPQTFNLRELLFNLSKEYQELAQARHIRLILRLRDVYIDSDPLLIERIIRNFLSNAVKYTTDKVLISCRNLPSGAVIRVADNGVGIKEEEQCHIFDEFYQSCSIPNNRKNGAGLGLSIVKKIAGILDASISVRSKPNAYTIFSLHLHN